MKHALNRVASLLRNQILALSNPWLDAVSSTGGSELQTQWDSWNIRQMEIAFTLHKVTQGVELTDEVLTTALDFLEGKTADRFAGGPVDDDP